MDGEEGLLSDLPGPEATPEFAVMVAEECRRRLDGLRETLRPVALLKMEGYTNEEIANRLGCGLRTVVRKLELIRKTWTADTEVKP
jgi:DNA-directed RNA polymerase specialized sigma24 family protein